MILDLEQFIADVSECKSEAVLYEAFQKYLDGFGIEFFAYFIIAHHLRASSPETGLIANNFPTEFADLYVRKNYMPTDPIVLHCLKSAEPFHWREIQQSPGLSHKHYELFQDQVDAGLIDGLAVPVFGPRGTICAFALSSLNRQIVLSDEQLLILQCACLQVNIRYFRIKNIRIDKPSKPLSPREKQALSLVADGLPTPSIAEKLGVSENTVDTLLRRAFAKLEVNNRISAVLIAVGTGAINL